MKTRRQSYAHYFIVGVCLFFVFSVGIINLKSDPISVFSEWNTLRHITIAKVGAPNSVPEILASIQRYSSDHGPLYFVLLRYWRDFVGGDLATYRLLSVFIGMLTLAFTYRLALITRNRTTALDALFITSFLAFFIYFTHEVRMYSLLPLLAAFVAWIYWQVVTETGRVPWWQWVSLSFGAAAIVYVHYFGIILLVAIGLYHLIAVPKNRRWFSICLAMVVAGLLFVPWLPVAIKGFTSRDVPLDDRLSFVESVVALGGIYTNGLILLVPVVIAAIVRRYKQLGSAQKYVLFLTLLIPLLMLAANEVAPLIIARRIRYTVVLAIPWTCALAIGLGAMPKPKLVRLFFAILWIAAFFVYTRSDDLSLYTNEKTTNTVEIPHFEDFVYTLGLHPRRNEVILSFHPFERLNQKVHHYYLVNLPKWRDIFHMYYEESGELTVQSWHHPDVTLEALSANRVSFWVIHNPQRTALSAMPVYSDWFLRHFRPCKRYVETDDNIIEYYISVSLPCELVLYDQPFAINYDNGTKLENLVIEKDADELRFYFWWKNTLNAVYSLTLQIFDSAGSKVGQIDDVLTTAGPDLQILNIAALPEGDYTVKLILYDRLSFASQPGIIIDGQQHFDRTLDLLNFSTEG